ncbi:MAG: acyl-CoA dehydrogenase family protein [Gammaproteobacteria bacterium]|nr:acyl-CoA dehydrogenase family protein [Gammaproteobacteria bacterium]
MDFSLSEEAQAIRSAAARFAHERVAPAVKAYRASNEMPLALIREFADLGYLGGVIPEAWGGAGMSFESLVAMVEEISTVDHVFAGQISHPSGLLGIGLLRYGSDAQKDEILRPLCAGAIRGAVAMSEPQGGSDVANMTTVARKDGGDYLLRGQKLFVSHTDHANFILTFARLYDAPDRAGICAFIVDRNAAGLVTTPIDDVGVLLPHSFVQVHYDDLRVPAARRLGAEGEGLRVAMCALESGRMALAARCCGAVRHCLESATAYARDRTVFGSAIGRYQMIQQKLADLAIGLTSARLLLYRLAWLKDQGIESARTESAMAKVLATELLERAASEAIQIFGGYGLTADYPWVQYLKDSKAFQVAEGTSEIQRMLIAEAVLGYREQGRFQLVS